MERRPNTACVRPLCSRRLIPILGAYSRYTGKNKIMSKKQLERVRRICLTLPETSEKLSHGEPTFFVQNKVFVMFANNHHNDGHIAVWLPVPPDFQDGLIETFPTVFFKPPYVGARGWIGIELDRISDQDLSFHIQTAWELIAPKRLLSNVGTLTGPTKPSPKRSAK